MTTLQDKLISPPLLAFSYAEGHFKLDTDTYTVRAGCVILQDHPDTTKRLIGYRSRLLAKAKQEHDTTQQGCLAIIWSVLLQRTYLKPTRFTVRSDHDLLQ